jgi:putative flavoprotein involved in K+ transport
VVPALSAGFGSEVQQLHSGEYRNPAAVGCGRDGGDFVVLVVGSGNSGLHIALELAATREVVLAAGSPTLMLPQRLLGRDLFWWLTPTGAITKSADSPIARRMRQRGDLVIGTRWRHLRRAGVDVRARLAAADGRTATFADGSRREVDAVVWATGFSPDHSWIDLPGAVRDGRLRQEQGITPVPGLFTIGQPWQRTRGSALLGFVQQDAEWLAERIAAQTGSAASAASSVREVMASLE